MEVHSSDTDVEIIEVEKPVRGRVLRKRRNKRQSYVLNSTNSNEDFLTDVEEEVPRILRKRRNERQSYVLNSSNSDEDLLSDIEEEVPKSVKKNIKASLSDDGTISDNLSSDNNLRKTISSCTIVKKNRKASLSDDGIISDNLSSDKNSRKTTSSFTTVKKNRKASLSDNGIISDNLSDKNSQKIRSSFTRSTSVKLLRDHTSSSDDYETKLSKPSNTDITQNQGFNEFFGHANKRFKPLVNRTGQNSHSSSDTETIRNSINSSTNYLKNDETDGVHKDKLLENKKKKRKMSNRSKCSSDVSDEDWSLSGSKEREPLEKTNDMESDITGISENGKKNKRILRKKTALDTEIVIFHSTPIKKAENSDDSGTDINSALEKEREKRGSRKKINLWKNSKECKRIRCSSAQSFSDEDWSLNVEAEEVKNLKETDRTEDNVSESLKSNKTKAKTQNETDHASISSFEDNSDSNTKKVDLKDCCISLEKLKVPDDMIKAASFSKLDIDNVSVQSKATKLRSVSKIYKNRNYVSKYKKRNFDDKSDDSITVYNKSFVSLNASFSASDSIEGFGAEENSNNSFSKAVEKFLNNKTNENVSTVSSTKIMQEGIQGCIKSQQNEFSDPEVSEEITVKRIRGCSSDSLPSIGPNFFSRNSKSISNQNVHNKKRSSHAKNKTKDDLSETDNVSISKQNVCNKRMRSAKVKTKDDLSEIDSDNVSISKQNVRNRRMRSAKVKTGDDLSEIDSDNVSISKQNVYNRRMRSSKVKTTNDLSDNVSISKQDVCNRGMRSSKVKTKDDLSEIDSDNMSISKQDVGNRGMRSAKVKTKGDLSEIYSDNVSISKQNVCNRSAKIKTKADLSETDSDSINTSKQNVCNRRRSAKIKTKGDRSETDSYSMNTSKQDVLKKKQSSSVKNGIKDSFSETESDSMDVSKQNVPQKKQNSSARNRTKSALSETESDNVNVPKRCLSNKQNCNVKIQTKDLTGLRNKYGLREFSVIITKIENSYTFKKISDSENVKLHDEHPIYFKTEILSESENTECLSDPSKHAKLNKKTSDIGSSAPRNSIKTSDNSLLKPSFIPTKNFDKSLYGAQRDKLKKVNLIYEKFLFNSESENAAANKMDDIENDDKVLDHKKTEYWKNIFFYGNEDSSYCFKSKCGKKYIVSTFDIDGIKNISVTMNFTVMPKPSTMFSKNCSNKEKICKFGCKNTEYNCIHKDEINKYGKNSKRYSKSSFNIWRQNRNLDSDIDLANVPTETELSDAISTDIAPGNSKSVDQSLTDLSSENSDSYHNASIKSDLVCVQCHVTFEDLQEHYSHLCLGKRKKGYLCKYCEKIFPSYQPLKRHKAEHIIGFK